MKPKSLAVVAALMLAALSSGCFSNSSAENVVRMAYAAVRTGNVKRLRKTLSGEALEQYGSTEGLRRLSQLLGNAKLVVQRAAPVVPSAETSAEFIRVEIGRVQATGAIERFLVSHVTCASVNIDTRCRIIVIESACEESQQLIDAILRDDTRTFVALVNGGADLDGTNAEGITPLMAAAGSGKLEAARILINRGANVSARDNWGYSALDRARAAQDVALIRLLVGAGAN